MPIFDKNKSRVKMVVLRSGKHTSIVWWSILDKDKGRIEVICSNMLRRFSEYLKKNPGIQQTINKIHFYEKGAFIGEATVN